MGQLGKQLYRKIPTNEKKRLAWCLDQIDEKYDLVLSARCLIRARNRQISRQNKRKRFHRDLKVLPKITIDESQKWTGSFKVIRGEPPIQRVKKPWKLNIQKLKHEKEYLKKKKDDKEFYTFKSFRFEKYRMRRRFKRSPYRLIDKDLAYEEKYSPQFKVKNMEKLESITMRKDVSPVSKFANFLRHILASQKTPQEVPEKESEHVGGKWPKTYETLKKLKYEMDKKKRIPGTKPYKFRMYDIVLENEEPTLSPSQKKSPEGIIHQGLQMMSSIIGNERGSKRKDANSKWLSPRFMPIMPDKIDTDNEIFSPSIMSFYKDNKTIAPLPDLFDSVGVSEHDRDSMLNMLMDVTGTTKHADKGIELLDALNFLEVKDDIFNATEHITSNFRKLENSLNFNQKLQIDKNGFTFMENHQIDKFYRDQGLEESIDLSRLDYYKNFTREQSENALWQTIEEIAQNVSSSSHRRRKRFFLNNPVQVEEAMRTGNVEVGMPIILAPFAFSPIFGFIILGPIILSPYIFSPTLINPSLLSPIILSPAVAVPDFISPYIFGPFILSPFVMFPSFLSPYAIGPNILNPFVLSPIILCPILLSPDILSPQMLGGGVLSPTMGSPAVLTETAFMITILSPSFLS